MLLKDNKLNRLGEHQVNWFFFPTELLLL